MWFRKEASQIDLNSKCPACGHRGCTLRYIAPQPITTDPDKGKTATKIEDAMVQRTCTTCGAMAYEKPVLPPEKWIGK